jgi:hypothetical protein
MPGQDAIFCRTTDMQMGTRLQLSSIETRSRVRDEQGARAPGADWTTLYRVAGIAAFAVVALIPIQAIVYILWPPPATVIDFFNTFQHNVVLGLLDLDVLLILDQVLIVLVLLGLYISLRRVNPSLVLVGTAIGLIGAVLFIISREATISMLWLSQQYAAAASDVERTTLLAAGQTLLATYNGTAFSVGYFLSGLAILVISMVMLRGAVFSRVTGVAGVAAGLTGLIPASFGTLGFVLSFVSLLPLVVWLALIGRRFLQLASRLQLDDSRDQSTAAVQV